MRPALFYTVLSTLLVASVGAVALPLEPASDHSGDAPSHVPAPTSNAADAATNMFRSGLHGMLGLVVPRDLQNAGGATATDAAKEMANNGLGKIRNFLFPREWEETF